MECACAIALALTVSCSSGGSGSGDGGTGPGADSSAPNAPFIGNWSGVVQYSDSLHASNAGPSPMAIVVRAGRTPTEIEVVSAKAIVRPASDPTFATCPRYLEVGGSVAKQPVALKCTWGSGSDQATGTWTTFTLHLTPDGAAVDYNENVALTQVSPAASWTTQFSGPLQRKPHATCSDLKAWCASHPMGMGPCLLLAGLGDPDAGTLNEEQCNAGYMMEVEHLSVF